MEQIVVDQNEKELKVGQVVAVANQGEVVIGKLASLPKRIFNMGVAGVAVKNRWGNEMIIRFKLNVKALNHERTKFRTQRLIVL